MIKKLFPLFIICLIFCACGGYDRPDNPEDVITVEMEDYFLFSWDIWQLTTDLQNNRYILDGTLENVSQDTLEEVYVKANFYQGAEKVGQAASDLGTLHPNNIGEFHISTELNVEALERIEIYAAFKLPNDDHPFQSETLPVANGPVELEDKTGRFD